MHSRNPAERVRLIYLSRSPVARRGIMHFSAIAWQENCASRLPAERVRLIYLSRSPVARRGIMHFSAIAWQENCASRLPAERLWLILNANPRTVRCGGYALFKEQRWQEECIAGILLSVFG